MLVFLPGISLLRGQDTIVLRDVEVTTPRRAISVTGKKKEAVDSAIRAQLPLASAAELLQASTPVFIRSYGSGGIASASLRGGHASQTAVLWNGFNLSNAMLGQSDLSMMPAIFFDDVSIEYGGSSALWGSGAAAGSIHLGNQLQFGKTFRIAVTGSAGSFNQAKAGGAVTYGNDKVISTTRMYHSDALNNYRYPGGSASNAAYRFNGLLHETRFSKNERNLFSVSAWLNEARRQVPDFNGVNRAVQEDKGIRASAGWSYLYHDLAAITRVAVFNDRIGYSAAAGISNSQVTNIIAEHEVTIRKPRSVTNGGIQVSRAAGIAREYKRAGITDKVSLSGAFQQETRKRMLAFAANARAEYFSRGALPVTGGISAEARPVKTFTLGISGSRVYRQPTLNELYWTPGGNPKLKPESGYTSEGFITWMKRVDALSIELTGAAFTRIINDWILWLPGAGNNPAPVNVFRVWSRGTESTVKIAYAKQHTGAGLVLHTSYVLSTPEGNHDDSNGRQLIYTPRYTGNSQLWVKVRGTSLSVQNQYAGYRFTATDNSAWLEPYLLTSVRVAQRIKRRSVTFSFFAACHNLLDQAVILSAGIPAPGRNYEAGLTIEFQNNR